MDTAPPPTPPEERLAGRLAAGTWARHPPVRTATRVLRELGQVDRAVYRAVAGTPTPALDRPVRRLSRMADRSRLWMAVAAVLAAAGGRTGRRAAAVGLAAVATDSALVNAGLKLATRRGRPDRDLAGVPEARWVPMPTSTSFPSGHTASGFAFAAAVARLLPGAALPLRGLAVAVGYSRVHTGVHFPADVVIGAVIGTAVGELVSAGGWRIDVRARVPLERAGAVPAR
ncbi:phosphatase PAP2 family protein [Blastococcus sp. SYSU D00695]